MAKEKERDALSALDVFDLTEKEYRQIVRQVTGLLKDEDTMSSIARKLGLFGSGPVAAKAFLFGRAVERNDSSWRKEEKSSCVECGEDGGGDDDDDLSPQEMVQLLDLMKKVVRAKQRGKDIGLPDFDALRGKVGRKKDDSDDVSYIG